MSAYFPFWEMCYRNRWVTLEQLQAARDREIITGDEYDAIVNA